MKNIYTELLNIKLHAEIYYYSKTRIKQLKDKLSMLHDEIIFSVDAAENLAAKRNQRKEENSSRKERGREENPNVKKELVKAVEDKYKYNNMFIFI